MSDKPEVRLQSNKSANGKSRCNLCCNNDRFPRIFIRYHIPAKGAISVRGKMLQIRFVAKLVADPVNCKI